MDNWTDDHRRLFFSLDLVSLLPIDSQHPQLPHIGNHIIIIKKNTTYVFVINKSTRITHTFRLEDVQVWRGLSFSPPERMICKADVPIRDTLAIKVLGVIWFMCHLSHWIIIWKWIWKPWESKYLTLPRLFLSQNIPIPSWSQNRNTQDCC